VPDLLSSRAARLTTIAGAALALTTAPALAAGVTRRQASALSKRAASHYVERYGVSHPARDWRASCRRRSKGGWRCLVTTRADHCAGTVLVTGTSRRPHARRAAIGCGE
jgi:hypothetical protein